MKSILTPLLFCLLMLAPSRTFADDGVLLLLNNGRIIGFSFKDKPIVISGSTLVIKSSDGISVEYSYEDVHKFYWGDVTNATYIDAPKIKDQSKVVFKITDEGISVKGLGAHERVSVYSLDGKLVSSILCPSENGSVALKLPDGKAFIVRSSSGISYKFIKH